MSALSLLSIGLLLAALVGCAVLWTRSGEIRVGLFGALLALIAIEQAVAAWANWGDPFGANTSTFGALLGLAVGAFAVLALIAHSRTLAERDRAEKLHWDSMETVRAINELVEASAASFDDKIDKLLAAGIARFGLEIAMLSRIRGDRYEIVAVRAPDHFPVAPGAGYSLAETYCKHTFSAERPIAIERISESNWVGSVSRPVFPFNAYLGARVEAGGAPYGTLSFASFEPHAERFNGTEKDLVRLMAEWIGSELSKRSARKAGKHTERAVRADIATETPKRAVPTDPSLRAPQKKWERPAARQRGDARSRQRADRPYVGRVIDPNRILQRMTGELRALAGGSVEFALKLDPSLGFAAAHNLPLKSIARTLVLNARDAMPDGGQLVVETANLEVAAGEPGEVPARAPDRYVTISFSDTGSELDPDTLSRLFDNPPDDGKQGRGSDRLALSTIYRVLQICGGDLSVNVEPGIGSTFTVFLPRAGARPTAPRRTAAAQAPANASPAPSSHAAPPTLH